VEWLYACDARALQRLAAEAPHAAAVALRVLVRSGGHPHRSDGGGGVDVRRWPVPLGGVLELARAHGVHPSTLRRSELELAATRGDDGRWTVRRSSSGGVLEDVDPDTRPQWVPFPVPLADRLCSLLALGRPGRAAFAVGLTMAVRLRLAAGAGRSAIVAPVRQLARWLRLAPATVVRALATLVRLGLICRRRARRARAPYVYSASSAVLAPTVARRSRRSSSSSSASSALLKHGACATETPLRGTRGSDLGAARSGVLDALRAWGGGVLEGMKAKGAALLATKVRSSAELEQWLEAEGPALRTAHDPAAWLVRAVAEGWTAPGKRSLIARKAAELERKAAEREARRARRLEADLEADLEGNLEGNLEADLEAHAQAAWNRRARELEGNLEALEAMAGELEGRRRDRSVLEELLEAARADQRRELERREAELEERRRRSDAARARALAALGYDADHQRSQKNFAQNQRS